MHRISGIPPDYADHFILFHTDCEGGTIVAMTEKQAAFFVRMYEDYAEYLWKFAYRKLGDSHIAWELVQDTFVVLLLKIDKIIAHEKPAAWLFDVMGNQIQHEKRQFAVRGGASVPLDECYELAADIEIMDGLEELIPSAFTEAERNLFLWYYRDQRTFREISGKLGISEDACRMQIKRLRKRLEKILRNL